VWGHGTFAATVGRELLAAGVRQAEVLTDAAGDGTGTPAAPAGISSDEIDGAVEDACVGVDLLIACLDTPRDLAARVLARVTARAGLPWLPVLVFGGSGFVGPLFTPPAGPCLDCVWAREQANWADPALTAAYYDRLARDGTSLRRHGRLPGFEGLVSQWATLEATKFLSRFTIPAILGSVLRIDFIGGVTQVHRVLRIPRCRGCSPAVLRPQVNGQLFARSS
jgi:bacteriocin biosynthesis cyclodehydratase domain-containing protein